VPELDGRGASDLGVEAFGHLPEDGEAHGDVEPVDQVLGLRAEVEGQFADVVAAVSEERDLLVRLHPLRLERNRPPVEHERKYWARVALGLEPLPRTRRPMKDLARRAGVSRATVFSRFGSKLGVLEALTVRCAGGPEMRAIKSALAIEDPVEAL
jgi:hypothetical protein